MAKIFISYRRDDSIDATGRIDDRLAGHFGRDEVFRDINAIQPGEQFPESIREALESCQVLLVIIGEDWADARHEDGTKRLHDKNDYVRWEIETALAKGILVIPVLVRWGTLPKSEQLPDSLQPLLKRNATEVRSDRDFHSHVDRLIRDLESHVGNAAPNADALPPLERQVHVVPKGIRSFDADDADFYLDLLPGPRDRHGLPDSIRFWKTRIEETDPTRTFGVGLIYGPSGCGKSSLVKAGLLPRLDKSVTPVFVEASDSDTESRLLRALQRRFSGLPIDSTLETAVQALRAGSLPVSGQKVLIVIDQFEQWLQSHPDVVKTELVRALLQSDGEHVQCVILVRDDFYLGASRFFEALDADLSSSQNQRWVDLFDLGHAKKVLTLFGQAYGALPTDLDELNSQQAQFLQEAASGLGQEDRVVSVRLALFADMVKGKSWVPDTLNQLGGVAGVGVRFLEEKLEGPEGDSFVRGHSHATRKILRVLLPEPSVEIRRHWKSYEELRAASGYSNREGEFARLITVLNSELKLITPTDAVGEMPNGDSQLGEDRWYQLTHDYLVPSLREWLTRKQRETVRGRAELRLSEHAQLWTANTQRRFLPGPIGVASILCWTNRTNWTEPERQLMRHAVKYYGVFGGLFLVITLGLLLGGLEIRGRFATPDIVDDLLRAKPEQVATYFPQIESHRRWVAPRLKKLVGPDAVIPTRDQDRHEVFKQQANAAVALCQVGAADDVLPLFQHSEDPTRRSYLINRYAASGGKPDVLLQQLQENQVETSICQALILTLGTFDKNAFSAPDEFVDLLLQQFEEHPAPGIHGAATWVLNRWRRHGWIGDADWARLTQIENALSTGKCEGDRRWYITRSGLTFVVLAPADFWSGHPAKKRRLNHRFAISMTEVTVVQFEDFLRADNRESNHKVTISPQPDCPVNSVDWYSAAQYCDWLSSREGIDRREWCYESIMPEGPSGANTVDVGRSGYRLPQNDEWEYACRAGSSTLYSFGDSSDLLSAYACISLSYEDHLNTIPVTKLKPNDFGLFGMHGNVSEWCQEVYGEHGARICRGGDFDNGAFSCQSSTFGYWHPTNDIFCVGFRVARTYK